MIFRLFKAWLMGFIDFAHLPIMSADFYYKGLAAEDRIFAKSPSESAVLAKGTLYEAWFDVLQTSPWYREIAQTGIFPSDGAKRTWQNFGDLENKVFESWWLTTGYQIFAENVPYYPMQIADLDVEVRHPYSRPPTLKIEVPLNLSPTELQKQLGEIIRAHAAYSSESYDRWNYSTAPVHQHRETRLTFQSIRRWLQVCRNYEQLRASENITLSDFALKFKLIPKFKPEIPGFALTASDRQKLANATSDILKPVRNLMANATEGIFPSTEPHSWATGKSRE